MGHVSFFCLCPSFSSSLATHSSAALSFYLLAIHMCVRDMTHLCGEKTHVRAPCQPILDRVTVTYTGVLICKWNNKGGEEIEKLFNHLQSGRERWHYSIFDLGLVVLSFINTHSLFSLVRENKARRRAGDTFPHSRTNLKVPHQEYNLPFCIDRTYLFLFHYEGCGVLLICTGLFWVTLMIHMEYRHCTVRWGSFYWKYKTIWNTWRIPGGPSPHESSHDESPGAYLKYSQSNPSLTILLLHHLYIYIHIHKCVMSVMS